MAIILIIIISPTQDANVLRLLKPDYTTKWPGWPEICTTKWFLRLCTMNEDNNKNAHGRSLRISKTVPKLTKPKPRKEIWWNGLWTQNFDYLIYFIKLLKLVPSSATWSLDFTSIWVELWFHGRFITCPQAARFIRAGWIWIPCVPLDSVLLNE